jgi:hypothetical protein
MNGKKVVLLFIAFLLPICIFLFLKFFGKNEFDVEPLFQDDKVGIERKGCGEIKLPYRIPDSVLQTIVAVSDSLAIICFDKVDEDRSKVFPHLKEEFKSDPIHFTLTDPGTEAQSDWFACVFLMEPPLDIVMVDRKGVIRGQYESTDRDEIDRLKTEIAIILKRY